MTQPEKSYSDASSRLFGHPVPADQDPAMLIRELRALRPLMTELHQARDTIAALKGMTPILVQDFRRAMGGYGVVLERLDTANGKMDRLDELIQLLDELEVLARPQ